MNSDLSDIGGQLTNSLAADGQTTMTGQIKAMTGSAATPSYTFGSQTNMGFYNAGANTIGVAIAGISAGSFGASGASIAGTLGTGGSLTVTGDVNASGVITAGGLLTANAGFTYTGPVIAPVPVAVVGGTYTVGATDYILKFSASCTVTFPSAASSTGRMLHLLSLTASALPINSASSNVTIFGGALTNHIIGSSAVSGIWAVLQSTGATWLQIAGDTFEI